MILTHDFTKQLNPSNIFENRIKCNVNRISAGYHDELLDNHRRPIAPREFNAHNNRSRVKFIDSITRRVRYKFDTINSANDDTYAKSLGFNGRFELDTPTPDYCSKERMFKCR